MQEMPRGYTSIPRQLDWQKNRQLCVSRFFVVVVDFGGTGFLPSNRHTALKLDNQVDASMRSHWVPLQLSLQKDTGASSEDMQGKLIEYVLELLCKTQLCHQHPSFHWWSDLVVTQPRSSPERTISSLPLSESD
jgi:hypothetical protein